MKITLLGTAAAEGYPGIFCECENCLQARVAGGKNIRLRSSVLINDDLLIDPGPDILAATCRYPSSLASLKTILVTHFHEDHWLPANLLMRHKWFHTQELPILHVYGGSRLKEEMEVLCRNHNQTMEEFEMQAHVIEPFERFLARPYQVRAFPAIHSADTSPLFYAITQDDRRLLYVTDTGPLTDDVWAALRDFRAHLIIMEMTMGTGWAEVHLGQKDFLIAFDMMKRDGVMAEEGRMVAHHFSHHQVPLHDQLEAELAEYGIIAAYDGLNLEV